MSTQQTLKLLRFVTGWPQVKFFGWNAEDFKKGSRALCDPDTGNQRKVSISEWVREFVISRHSGTQF